MTKPGTLIIFIVIFLMAFFLINRLSLCKNNFLKLKDLVIHHKNNTQELSKKITAKELKKDTEIQKKREKRS